MDSLYNRFYEKCSGCGSNVNTLKKHTTIQCCNLYCSEHFEKYIFCNESCIEYKSLNLDMDLTKCLYCKEKVLKNVKNK